MKVLTTRGPVLGVLLLAGLLGFLASGQPWFRAIGDQTAGASGGTAPGAADGAITFSGAEASGGLTQALPAVVLAGVLLTLVLAVRGRRVVSVLLGLAGVGMLAVGLLRTPPSAAAVRTRFRQVSLADSYVLDATVWSWPYVVAGFLVLAGAVLLWLGSPTWARRTRRYERGRPGSAAADPEDPAAAWGALDAGLDPTVESATGHESASSSDPDVRSDGPPDTMGGQQPTPQSTPRRQIGDS